MSACPSTGRHGDLTAYWQDGCRCPEVRALSGRRQKEYRLGRRRLIDATGTRRRLQALAVAGWDQRTIAPMLGCTQRALSELARGARVRATTETRIRRLYDQLAHQPGPNALATTRALRRGWLGPEWWDPDTIDDPAYDPVLEVEIAGAELEAQDRAHRLLEVHRLTEAGLSAREIAQRVGTTQRTVERDRAKWAS